ncbi:ComEA family DNA-binding protein [Desulfuromonas acetexigens]|uniref:Helix-hairpin-helix domain-containing protein n=1 Tax=Trichloromonas acetexigens TaxID=38815 RepID=A0A550JJC6_9BACT|nr:helix-hairpin-helix domain-containing protein [Desulfuromonas acetexigens]TRO83321.1 helix-hairpin-helix domain-containing protein [Desulfuromonas acetexigens]
MNPPRGTCLLVGCLVFCLGFFCGRRIFFDEDPPAVAFSAPPTLPVWLGNGFTRPGLHQFSDASSWASVIELTDGETAREWLSLKLPSRPPQPGERLSLGLDEAEKLVLVRDWLPAEQRMALGVALHPERMSLDDWQALPGIGPRLAERIEADRQKNGDFGDFEALLRVPGVGRKSLERWRKYFE